jgi:HK97 family phage prohead protease
MSEIMVMRVASLVDAEVKGRMFRGYAAVFDAPWSDDLVKKFGYVEKVARGAFRKALQKKDNVPLLLGHDRNMVLGTTRSGNVKLTEEPRGLLTEAKLPDNHLGEYTRSMIESGDLGGMSYGISLDPARDIHRSVDRSIGLPVQIVKQARKILDVSITWEPSYEATDGVQLRSQGFVAIPLQESVGGEEPQPNQSGNEDQTPDDQEAWWGDKDDPAEASTDQEPHIPYWERFARQIEKEY